MNDNQNENGIMLGPVYRQYEGQLAPGSELEIVHESDNESDSTSQQSARGYGSNRYEFLEDLHKAEPAQAPLQLPVGPQIANYDKQSQRKAEEKKQLLLFQPIGEKRKEESEQIDDWILEMNKSVMATNEERKYIEKEEEEADDEIPSEDSHCQNWQHNLDQRLASSKVCIVGFNDVSDDDGPGVIVEGLVP